MNSILLRYCQVIPAATATLFWKRRKQPLFIKSVISPVSFSKIPLLSGIKMSTRTRSLLTLRKVQKSPYFKRIFPTFITVSCCIVPPVRYWGRMVKCLTPPQHRRVRTSGLRFARRLSVLPVLHKFPYFF